jgi:hypothetical protein
VATDVNDIRNIDPTAGYAPGEGRPLAAYAVLTTGFFAGLAGALAGARATGRAIDRPGVSDVVLGGLATQKVSRLIAKDKVTSFLRAPFTRYQERAGHGELEEAPRGRGMQYATGELLVCPRGAPTTSGSWPRWPTRAPASRAATSRRRSRTSG